MTSSKRNSKTQSEFFNEISQTTEKTAKYFLLRRTFSVEVEKLFSAVNLNSPIIYHRLDDLGISQ